MNDRQKNRTESRNLQAILEDTARLEKLRRLRLLDSPADPAFDRLTRLASDILNMPVSLVSLVDVDRQFFKSQVGLPEPWATTRQTPLSHSFCQHVVATNEPLIIENARQHPLVQDNLAVTELNVIAYAGIPLITSDNVALGSFCAIDDQPHEWTQKEIDILSGLAAAVMAEIELRDELLKRQEAEKRLKSKQKALSMAHQELERILQNSLDMIGTANFEGYFTHTNSACETILGYTPEELLERPFIEFVHPDDIEETQTEARKLAKGKVTHSFHNRYRTKEGDYRWLTWNATANTEKGLIYFVARDDTDKKQAKEKLQQALEQEKELNQLKSRFVSMVLHEFRTPLTTILSSIGLLEHVNGTTLSERQLKYYGKVRTAVNHMTELLDDVLLIGKAESGCLKFRPELLDLKQLCQNIAEDMQLVAKETHQIHFAAQFEQEQVLLDKSLMRQILTNLLSNAIKYSPQGGTVTFSLSTEANCLVLRVCDEGIGIPARDQARLFETFHRADNVDNISGTGLGLAIVHKAVTLHGGVVNFTSEEGEGTEFIVEIPLER